MGENGEEDMFEARLRDTACGTVSIFKLPAVLIVDWHSKANSGPNSIPLHYQPSYRAEAARRQNDLYRGSPSRESRLPRNRQS